MVKYLVLILAILSVSMFMVACSDNTVGEATIGKGMGDLRGSNSGNSSCIDTDGGPFVFIKGTTIGDTSWNGNFGNFTDYCVYGNVTEYYCSGVENPLVYQFSYYCENGCYDGACLINNTNTTGGNGTSGINASNETMNSSVLLR